MRRIRLENLVKRYGNVEVLHGINLEMGENEFTVLVGPSGCGKSTTLRMIAGLESVTEGEIYIDDRPISNLEPKDRDIAMVFQDYALYPHMNVAKNMSFALRLEGRPKQEISNKVNKVAEMLGLKEFLYRKPGELSGGQRQRVAMGRALVRDAGTFLFDEPLSNLDAKLRTQMRTELALMRQTVKKSMIYVTHDQIEAMTLADRIVVMHGGYIQQQGTPRELFVNPSNKFVASFLGSPAMNFLDGEVQQSADGIYVVGAGFNIKLPDDKAAAVQAQNSRNVLFGIRPSHLSYEPQAPKNESLDLRVVVSEYIGSQSVLLTKCGEQEVKVKLRSTIPVEVGATMRFHAARDAIRIFDRETEAVISSA